VAPEVICEFSTGGRRFEVTRSPAWDRPTKRGKNGTTTAQAQSRLREFVGGSWVQKSTRNDEVDDPSNLFVARVSLNRYGEVVGARILTARPGAKADRAANAIWTFRYTPALDDDGMPVNSTLDQEFQIR